MLLRLLQQRSLNVFDNNVYPPLVMKAKARGQCTHCTLILYSALYDNICALLLRLNVSHKVWFHKPEPLFETTFDISASVSNITKNLFSHHLSVSDCILRQALATHFSGQGKHPSPPP